MKLKRLYSLLLSFSLLFVLDATAFTQETLQKKVTLQVSNAEIKKVLKLIEDQAMVKFAYSPENLHYNNKISLSVKKGMLSEVLDKILAEQDMVYEAIDNLIVLKKNPIKLVDIVVTGKVLDETGLPLPGVSVKVKNSTTGTSTDTDGNYSLRDVDENAVLIFSFIGFTSQEIPVNGKSVLNISMVPDSKALSEVVVIGYGTQKRENIIGSVSQVTAADLENRPVTQLSNALTGQMTGVTVVQRSGRPGDNAGSIRVRGVGSFGANSDALVIVDGIPGDFNNIDPNDVASISVLKDASSAAIYGARAANGVILVTTKTGQQGKVRVSYNGYSGIQSPTAFPDYASSAEFAEFYNVALGSEFFSTEEIQKFRDGSDPDNYPNTDFLGAIFSRNGLQTGNNLSISGGGPANQFNLSLGHLYQQGLVVRNDLSRFNVRLNMNTDLGPKFKLTTRLSAIKVKTDEPAPPAGGPETTMLGIVGQAVRFLPIYAGRFSNGDYDPGNIQTGTPISYIESVKSFYEDQSLALTSNLRLDYNVIDDLKLSFVAGYNQTDGENKLFLATQRINDDLTVGPNQLTQNIRNNTYYTVQGLVEYNKSFGGKHQLGILGGYSFERNDNSNFLAFRDKLPGNDLTELAVGADDNQRSGGTSSAWALESQFARANYSFANKYLIEGVVRRDGSSRFPTTRKYAVFPSAAIGWRISQENFFKDNISWINELKLKASVGILGNQNISNYPYQNVLVNGQTYSFGGIINSGAARTRITDPTLQWESTRNTDIGLESTVFNEKLNFSATYFDRYTYDILSSPGGSVSNTLGFDLSAQNSGKLENKGWEFTANHSNKLGNLTYNIGGNLSIIKNKVLDLGVGNIIQPNGMTGNGSSLFIGSPLQIYYGYQADGLFVDDADISAWVDQTAVNPDPQPGDIRYRDISGPDGIPDGIVDNTYDRVVLGSNIPKYTYGINLGAGLKGFDFSMLFQGIAGVESYQDNYVGWAYYNGATVQRWQIEERWTPENPNRNATYPRFEILPNANTPNTQESSFWMINGSYLRIKNAQIGYTLPANAMKKLKIGSIRLYVSGENLLTLSNFRQGWDPETGGNYNDVNSTSTTGDYYPILSNYTFGINVKF